MESRHFPRLLISIQVDIFIHAVCVGHYNTKDISFDGIGFVTDSNCFHVGSVVDVRLESNNAAPILKAIVVHSTQEVTGVLITEYSHVVFKDIFELYKKHQILLKRSLIGIDALYDRIHH